MNKKLIEKIMIFTAVVAVLSMFAFFLWDVMVPLFRMELNNDVDGARALLESRGAAGGAAVSLIEALQMVVIFIPAEFIQVSSGLSYPFYIAFVLCDLGVCLGASMIFLLVRTFRFGTDKSRKSAEQIERISADSGERGVQMLMYLLFITPIIPFGAICYYGSGTRIRYRRYIFTVATGVIPSIITSNVIGSAAKAFLMNAVPLWLLVLIIILMAGLLFVLLWLFLDKIYFKGRDGTPESATAFVGIKLASLWRRHCQRLTVDNEKLRGLEPPFVVLCNHESFYDFYYVIELLRGYTPAYVINHHVLSAPVFRRIYKKAGAIPKKMFYPDTAGVKILRTLKKGYPVVVFPEGRLSPDGRGSAIVEDAAALYKRAGAPIVLANIRGAYFSCPKWRGSFYRSDVSISAVRVITADELRAMSADELSRAIGDSMTYNESESPVNRYRVKNPAKGLDTLIYRCADCGALYTVRARGRELHCESCGSSHILADDYLFDGGAMSIPDLYDRVKELERAELGSLDLTAEVEVTVYSDKKPYRTKQRGVCSLDRERFTYRSDSESFSIDTAKIPALAFSCGKEFELYHNGLQYYFYPVGDRRQVIRWSIVIDLLREERIAHGKE